MPNLGDARIQRRPTMHKILSLLSLLCALATPAHAQRHDVSRTSGAPGQLSDVASAVTLADQAAIRRGGRVQIAVLGTTHLRDAPKSIQPQAFDPLVARLAAFKPDLIAVESLSGAQCDYLHAYSYAYEDTAKTYCFDTSVARDTLKLEGAAAEREMDEMFSSGLQWTPARRRRLIALFLAVGEPASACVQWLRLPVAERVADEVLSTALVAQIEKKLSQRSEDSLIAIPLAVKLGLERIYPVDDHTGDRATGPIDEAVWQADMTRLWQNPRAAARHALLAKARDRVVADGDVLRWYRWLNSTEEARLAVASDFAAAAGDNGVHRTGRAYLSYWETRNLRMAANVREVVGRFRSNRALVVVGTSHKPYYERYLGITSDVQVFAIDALLK